MIGWAQVGDALAIDEIIRICEPMIHFSASKCGFTALVGALDDEHIQTGRLALMDSIRHFDEKRGQFSTFACKLIHRALWREYNRRKDTAIGQVEEMRLADDARPLVDDVMAREMLAMALDDASGFLLQRHRQAIEYFMTGRHRPRGLKPRGWRNGRLQRLERSFEEALEIIRRLSSKTPHEVFD